MRQVTGSNSAASNKEVSIQLQLGGHSFSAAELPAELVAGDAAVCFVVNTHKVTLVPVEEFEPALAADCLAVAGLACADNETAVYSAPRRDCIAVMAIDTDAYVQIVASLQERAAFTSPLLDASHNDYPDNLYLQIAGNVCYMRYADMDLKMAEALQIESAEDLLYYVWGACSLQGGGRETTVYLAGDHAAKPLLKNYFKRVICE